MKRFRKVSSLAVGLSLLFLGVNANGEDCYNALGQKISCVTIQGNEEEMDRFIVTANDKRTVGVYISAKDGTFLAPFFVGDDLGVDYGEFAIADFTGDGRTDFIASTNEDPARLYLFKRTGVTSFEQTFLETLNEDPRSAYYLDGGQDPLKAPDYGLGLTAADIDGDSDIDFIENINHCWADDQCWLAKGNTYLNDGSGVFTKVPESFDFKSISTGWTLGVSSTVIDVNGDRHADMLASEQSSGSAVSSKVYLLAGKDDGTFDGPTHVFTTDHHPATYMTLGDLNNDGKADALVGLDDDGDPGAAFLFLGHGDGTFEQTGTEVIDTRSDIETGSNMPGGGKFQAYDVDRDGKLDIIAAPSTFGPLPTSPLDVKSLLFFRGMGDGTFDEPQEVVSNILTPLAFQLPPIGDTAVSSGDVFSDDFDDGDFDGWQEVSYNGVDTGNWKVINGKVGEESNSAQGILAHHMGRHAHSSSYSISVDVHANVNGWNDNAGVTFGYEDRHNYYMVKWDDYSPGYSQRDTYRDFVLIKVENGITETILDSDDKVDLPSDFTLDVTVSPENGIVVSVDGVERLRVVDEHPAIGTIGLNTHDNDGGVYYDDVNVSVVGVQPVETLMIKVFSDDFNDDRYDGWEEISYNGIDTGNWKVTNGQVGEKSNSAYGILAHEMGENATNNNYRISVDVHANVDGWNDNVGVTFGYKDRNNYFMVKWDDFGHYEDKESHKAFLMVKVEDGVETIIDKVYHAELPDDFVLGVSVSPENGIIVSVDGVVRLGSYDKDHPALGVFFGLNTEDNDSGVSYDNVVISKIIENSIHDNTPPVAYAGEDIVLDTSGDSIILFGSGYDADGDELTYKWTLLEAPEGVPLYIYSDAPPPGTAMLNTSEMGVYKVQLIVNDGIVDSAPDTMTVTATQNWRP